MATIVEFPSLASSKWAEWEREIRVTAKERNLPDSIVNDALPRLKRHWEAIFVAVELELPSRPVPGELTRKQAVAIQKRIDDAAQIVLDRLRYERSLSFQRFVVVELALSNTIIESSPRKKRFCVLCPSAWCLIGRNELRIFGNCIDSPQGAKHPALVLALAEDAEYRNFSCRSASRRP